MSHVKPALRISRIGRYATPGVPPAPSGSGAAYLPGGDERVGRAAGLDLRHEDSDIRALLGQCCEARIGIGILTGS
jgi:hypothetical protein